MKIITLLKGGILAGMLSMATGCIVAEPHEGYYDHDHNRYYYGHVWHDCGYHDDHCR